MATIADRVKATARILDEKYPSWFTKIDLDTLDMYHGCYCIAGQLEAAYGPRPDYLDLQERFGRFERFTNRLLSRLSKSRRTELVGEEYSTWEAVERLAFGTRGKRAWIAEILARRAAVTS